MTTVTSKSTLASIAAELDALALSIQETEPEEILNLRTGATTVRVGNEEQYFTTWATTAGLLRDYAARTLYPVLRLAVFSELTLAQTANVMKELEAGYNSLLSYSGFPTLTSYTKRLQAEAAQKHTDPDEWIAAMKSLLRYVNRLDAWSHHYFPWYLGEHFAKPVSDKPEPIVNTSEPLKCEGPQIRLTWQPYGISVRATLASNLNEQLCTEFLESVPFRVLQDHAVVAGESMFAWTPAVSLASVQTRERVCDAPPGRLRFQQATGQKIVVAYGTTTETVSSPVLGAVFPEDVHLLPQLGKHVMESTFRNKEHIWLEVTAL